MRLTARRWPPEEHWPVPPDDAPEARRSHILGRIAAHDAWRDAQDLTLRLLFVVAVMASLFIGFEARLSSRTIRSICEIYLSRP